MFYCSLPISYRWGQTNKNTIGGDRRTKFNRLGQTNKSSIGGDRQTEVQQYLAFACHLTSHPLQYMQVEAILNFFLPVFFDMSEL